MSRARFILWRHSQPVAIVASAGPGADVMRVLSEAPDALAGYNLAWLLNYQAEQGSSLLDHPDLEAFGLYIAAYTEGTKPPQSALYSKDVSDHLEALATGQQPEDLESSWEPKAYRYALVTDSGGRFIARIGSAPGQPDHVHLYHDASSLLEAGFELGRLNWEAAQSDTPLEDKLRGTLLAPGRAVDSGLLSAEAAVRDDATIAALQEANPPLVTTAMLLRHNDGTPLAVLVVRGSERQLLSPMSLPDPEHDRPLQALREMQPLILANYCRTRQIAQAVPGVRVGAQIENYTSLGVYMQRQEAIDELWECLVELSADSLDGDVPTIDVSEMTNWLSPADQIQGHCSTITAYAELGGGSDDATRIVKAACDEIHGLIDRLTQLSAEERAALRDAVVDFKALTTVAGLKVSDAESLAETIQTALYNPPGSEACL